MVPSAAPTWTKTLLIPVAMVILALTTAGATTPTQSTFIDASCSNRSTCTEEINDAIKGCSSPPSHEGGGWCSVTLGPGTFVLDTSLHHGQRVIDISSVANLHFSGQGVNSTTLLLSNISFLLTAFNATNATFSDFAVDMVRLPFTSGKVTSTSATSVSVSIDPSVYPVDDGALYPWLHRAQAVIGYDPLVERFQLPDIYRLADPFPIEYSPPSNDSSSASASSSSSFWTMTLQIPKGFPAKQLPSAGEVIVVRHQVYAYNGLTFSDCKDITVERVTLYSVPGMGVLASKTTNILLNQFETRRWRSPSPSAVSSFVRPMSITADGIHLTNMRGGKINITNCFLEGQGDDGLNANTRFARVEATPAPNQIVGGQGIHGTKQSVAEGVWAGAVLELFNGRTMEPMGFTPPVAGVDDESGIITFVLAIIPSVPLYTLFVNANATADSTLVQDTTFLNNRARGSLLKQPNLLARRNSYSGMTSPAVLTEVDGCFWFEGRPLHNWTFSENSVQGLGQFGVPSYVNVDGQVPVFNSKGQPTTVCASISGAIFDQIRFENNVITMTNECPSPAPAAIEVFGSVGGVVIGTSITTPKGYRGTAEIVGHGCSNFTIGRNTCSTSIGGPIHRCNVTGF